MIPGTNVGTDLAVTVEVQGAYGSIQNSPHLNGVVPLINYIHLWPAPYYITMSC